MTDSTSIGTGCTTRALLSSSPALAAQPSQPSQPARAAQPTLAGPAVLWVLAAAFVALLGADVPARAQMIPPDSDNPLPYLLDVGDAFALVRYSPGALDRASHVQKRFALLAVDFGKWSKQPAPLSAILLSRTDWEALELAVPYGLPAHMANGEVALCAWGDYGTVNLWRSLLGGELPPLEGHPLYGSKLEASSLLLNDLLAQGVAARALLNRAGFGRVHPEVLNLTAHVIALAASNLHESLSLGVIRRIYSIPAADPSMGAPKGDAVWRARLAGEVPYYQAAEALIAKRGVSKAPKALLKLLRRDGTALTPRAIADRFPEVRGLLPNT